MKAVDTQNLSQATSLIREGLSLASSITQTSLILPQARLTVVAQPSLLRFNLAARSSVFVPVGITLMSSWVLHLGTGILLIAFDSTQPTFSIYPVSWDRKEHLLSSFSAFLVERVCLTGSNTIILPLFVLAIGPGSKVSSGIDLQ